MKILYVLNSTNVFGGSTKSFLRYIEELTRFHSELQVVICAPSVFPNNIIDYAKVKIYKTPIVFHIYPSTKSIRDKILFLPKLLYKSIINFLSFLSIYKIAKKEQVDIIHTNVSVVNSGFLAAKKLGIPHIYHIREYQTSDFGMKIIPSFSSYIKSLKSNRNFNICITYGIQKHFSLDNNNSIVIYNGVKHFSYHPLIENKEKYFLFVGRLEKNKGIRSVITVFTRFSKENDDFRLLIAGDTNNISFKKELVSYIASKKMDKRIIFLGNRKDIDDLMQRATAIIVSSSREAFGLITAEAAFNKCLVIGKNVGGTAEQIENGLKLYGEKAGIGYMKDEELLEILIKVSQKTDFKSITDTAYRTALKLYSIESCSKSIYNLYSSIIDTSYHD